VYQSHKPYVTQSVYPMKTLKKVSLIFLAAIAILVLIVLFYTGRLAKKGLPDYNAGIEMKTLYQPVKVYRDSFAIPHIYAKNEHDLYMVTGYLMAQDRMWQMDLLRRVTLGRLSEIFGDDFVGTDILLRSLSFKEKSESILAEADSSLLIALNAFSEGVNAYIANSKGNLPLEFTILGYKPELWEPSHSLNLIGYMAWDLKSGWSELLLEELSKKVDSAHFTELLPDLGLQRSYVFGQHSGLLAVNKLRELSKLEDMGLDIFSGSNNWAVSGNRSVTGKPLLANDMHLGFGIPGIWLQIHQVIAGKLNVEGLALPGQPMIIVGHNDSIAWGMTNTYVDNLDYYEEKINPEDSNQYMLNGEWKKFIIHREIIKSKSGKEFTRVYKTNHRGPVISEVKGITDRVLTMHWVGSEQSNEFRTIYLLNRARNWNEFKDAFTTFRSISQNIAYADVRGNIGIYCCAGVPIRKRDKVWAVLPGWTNEYDWTGMVPFDSLPYEYNPERGYVSSANNRTVDSTYPYHIGTWYDIPYRLDRIREMLGTQEKYSIDDFKRMQNDQHSKLSELFLKVMLPAVENTTNWNETEKLALERLKQWDFNLGTESQEASICENWVYQFLASVYKDEMGDKLFGDFKLIATLVRAASYKLLMSRESVWIDDVETAKKESLSDIAAESFRKTISALMDEQGNDISKWKWGNIHQITLTHPLAKVKILDQVFGFNRGPYSVGGSFHTVSPYSYPFFEPKSVVHGASHRSIYDLGEWDNCVSVIPTGTSGIPASRFYCDQTKLYISGRYHHDYFREENVKKNARFEMEFSPTEGQ
jgi:penicillin G amidase